MGALTRLPQAPWVAGFVIGVVAVLAGTIGGVYPPEAYGFCTTCHGRDLVLGIVQPFFPGTFDLPTLWPLLTVVGVMAGAGLARRAAHERPSLDRIDRRLMAIRIIQGFVVMSFALLAMGCPIRLTVSAASLVVQGFIGLAGTALGIWNRRAVPQGSGPMIGLGLVTIGAGFIAGWVGQRSRFCTVGGLRDLFIARDTTLLLGVVALFAAAWLTFPLVDIVTSATAPTVIEQAEGLGGLDPLAVTAADEALNDLDESGGLPTLPLAAIIFVGGIGVGAVSTVVGGCPFRQHVLAGQGSRQARYYLVGFYIAALAFGFWSPALLRFILG